MYPLKRLSHTYVLKTCGPIHDTKELVERERERGACEFKSEARRNHRRERGAKYSISTSGSCADIMHSAQPFRNGFKQEVIAVILRDVVQGLDYLHNLGYVHR